MKIGGYFSNKLIARFIEWGGDALKGSKRFDPMHSMESALDRTFSMISESNFSGEGWFYTSQFILAADLGIRNFICTTPFNCLPVHLAEGDVSRPERVNH